MAASRITRFAIVVFCLLVVYVAPDMQDLPMCGEAFDETRNASCVRRQCADFGMIAEIPVALLDGYKDYSNIVRTEDGCTVKEVKGDDGNPLFVRLTVPFYDCKTQVKKFGSYLRYYSRPYIAYIGGIWKQYFLNVSCISKPKLPITEVDLAAIPSVFRRLSDKLIGWPDKSANRGLPLPGLMQDAVQMESSVAIDNSACEASPCKNNGICVTKDYGKFFCQCGSDYAGKICELTSPLLFCDDAGLTVDISIDIVRSLSGTPPSKIPTNVMLYFENHKTAPCLSTTVLRGTKSEAVYRLHVPVPFATCGLVSSQLSDSQTVVVSGSVFYERISRVSIIDTSVLLSDFACTYTTKSGVGLHPDEVLSAEFKPVPNSLFSSLIEQKGIFLVLVQFFIDAGYKIPLPSSPQIEVGSFLYVSLYSKLSLPVTMSLNVDTCYLTPHPDPRVKTAVLEIVKDNCPASNDLPKKITFVEKDKVSFMFQVFQLKGGRGEMYLHCATSLCDATKLSCYKNCGSTSIRRKRKRQLSRADDVNSKPKIVNSAMFYPTDEKKQQNSSEPGEDLGVRRKYLVTDVGLYQYLLAGLILFTLLLFSFVLVVILYHFRSPHPEKYVLHARRSYQSGRRLSESPPRTWTVVHALSPEPVNNAEPKRTQTYDVTVVNEIGSPENSRERAFSTFLGDPRLNEQQETLEDPRPNEQLEAGQQSINRTVTQDASTLSITTI